MKKSLLLLSISFSIFFLFACSNNVSQEDYDSLQESLNSFQTNYEALQKDFDSLSANNKKLQNDLSNLQSEYDSYTEKMKPYESLESAEAEARQIEADKIIAEQRAAEEAAAAKEAAAIAAEEAKGYETGITYDNIARNPDDYIGKKVKFNGKVIQLIEDNDKIQIRFAINNDYNKIVFCEYNPSIVTSRVLENDIITL